MKYVVIVGDRMPDYPIEELDGGTPLTMPVPPNMDKLAKYGEVGLGQKRAAGYAIGKRCVTNLSVMGYDPAGYYTGAFPHRSGGHGGRGSENDLAFPLQPGDPFRGLGPWSGILWSIMVPRERDCGGTGDYKSGGCRAGKRDLPQLLPPCELQAHSLVWRRP